jgi:hypothetical protein
LEPKPLPPRNECRCWSAPAAERQQACSETFSENSPFFTRGGEEVRFSILRPSAIQGEGATSPFSDLREWEERGVTTPIDELRLRTIIFLVEINGRVNSSPFVSSDD